MNKAQFKRVLKQVNDQHPDANLTREQKWQVLWAVAWTFLMRVLMLIYWVMMYSL